MKNIPLIATNLAIQRDRLFLLAIMFLWVIITNAQSFSNQFALSRYNEDGRLDPTFDTDGKVLTKFDGAITVSQVYMSADPGKGVVIDASGKIIAAGSVWTDADKQFALVKYNQDGSLDPTFGVNGQVMTNFSSASSEEAKCIALDRSGKIVVAGVAKVGAGQQFALARYNIDGSLDNTFDGDGKVLTDFSSTDHEGIYAIAIARNGKIIVAGSAGGLLIRQFALARYNTDGSLDESFDGDGKILIDFSSAKTEGAYAVGIDPDNKIVAAGYAKLDDDIKQFALARLNNNGSLDNTLDGDGIVLTDFGGSRDATANALVILSDGKIIVAGRANNQFALAKYNLNGSLDMEFSRTGKVQTDFSSTDFESAHAIVLDSRNNILVCGIAGGLYPDDRRFAIAKYRRYGGLDTRFDGDGKVLTDFSSARTEEAHSIAVDGSGKIVVAGSAMIETPTSSGSSSQR